MLIPWPSEEPSVAGDGGLSGLLGSGGENHRGGEAVHAQSRDVDLVTAIRRELGRDRDGSLISD